MRATEPGSGTATSGTATSDAVTRRRIGPVGIVAAAVFVLLAGAAVTGPPADAAQAIQYVALGDSSAAGPGIPNESVDGCRRSDRNWPRQLADRIDATLIDVTCSGAITSDLSQPRNGVTEQFKVLTKDINLVTLAIGANDIAMFEAFTTCGLPEPPTCQERFTRNGADVFIGRINNLAPRIGAALDRIHTLSPNAAVIVTGYLTYWQPGGCPATDPYSASDADYMQETFDRLMKMLAQQAAAHGASYVDIRTPSADHGLCAPADQRWLEGLVPDSPADAYHPNAAGMTNVAAIIAPQVPRP